MQKKSELKEVQCTICGAWFKTNRSNRKYCDKCKEQPTKAMREFNKGGQNAAQIAQGDDLVTYDCEYCGREHTVNRMSLFKVSISKSNNRNWDGMVHRYCCVEHMGKAFRDHDACDCCGQSLKGCDYPYNSNPNAYNFCSKECADKFEVLQAKRNGWYHTCERCGKDFIRKSDTPCYFCSQECYRAAVKDGWKSPNAKAPVKLPRYDFEYTCPNCGKKFTRQVIHPERDKKLRYCSRKCQNEHARKKATERREQAEKEKLERLKPESIENAKIEKAKRKEKERQRRMEGRRPDEHLCATCRTSYVDCERMSSNFRIIPKGAHYDGNGILYKCPKYS